MMKRDVQVGVVLGVIILAIIGVFLSTRTTVKEPIIPIPEEDLHEDLLNITELPQEPDGLLPSKETTLDSGTVPAGREGELYEEEMKDNIVRGTWVGSKENVIESQQERKEEDAVPLNREEEDTSLFVKTISQKKMHTVRPGDTLRKIARNYYGDSSKWLLIFNANQDKIHDRNSLRVGIELIIPQEGSTEKKKASAVSGSVTMQTGAEEEKKQSGVTHTVQSGDSLYKLAVKYYHDGSKWQKIFEANKHILKNKDILLAGQNLFIPDL